MSIMSSLFFILLCFTSMHANSEARYIGLGRSNKGFRALFRYPDKGQFRVVEKFRVGMDSRTEGSVLVQGDDDLAAAQKGTHGGAVFSSSATTTATKGIMEYAGSEIFEPSSSSAHMGMHKDKATTTTNKESRRGLNAKDTQTAYKKEDDDGGVVLEDYKPPHQTPPIHNKRT